MPLFNVYLCGRWIDEVLYLKYNGIEKTCEDVREYVHHMDTHPYVGADLSGWLDISFYTVMPARLTQ